MNLVKAARDSRQEYAKRQQIVCEITPSPFRVVGHLRFLL